MSGLEAVPGLVARAFWLAAPVVIAGILHMIVVRRDLFAALKRPLDGGRTFRGQPIFGPNKTWRGLAFMTLASPLLGAVQGLAWGEWAERAGLAPCDLALFAIGRHLTTSVPVALAIGYAVTNLLLGLGYALGELPNSFVKRRVGIEPGKTSSRVFFVVDQADSVVAAFLVAKVRVPLDWDLIVVGIVVLTLLHLILNGALYLAKVRRNL